MAGPTLDELIANARTAPRPHRDVQVTLDAAIAARIQAIDERLLALNQEQIDLTEQADAELTAATADARLGDPRRDEITTARDAAVDEVQNRIDALDDEREALTEGTLVTFRFSQLPGQAWADLGARHPARIDVNIDRAYGYNYHEVAKAAAAFRDLDAFGRPTGEGYAARVIPPESDDAEATTEPVSPEQWDALWGILTGHEFERIATALWALNDYGPQQRIAAAGKASRAGSGSKSSSPARLGSAPDASPDGSPVAP
jgi:hypothetical protein